MQISRMIPHEHVEQTELPLNFKKHYNPYSSLSTLLQALRLALEFYCSEPTQSQRLKRLWFCERVISEAGLTLA